MLANGFARARCAGCGHDFLIAFSGKGRGVCPSCNTRPMAELAAQGVDPVFLRVPVCQWVLLLPKRLRYFLPHDPALRLCPYGGEPLRIIALITEALPIQRLLLHLGEPSEPPPLAPARGPRGRVLRGDFIAEVSVGQRWQGSSLPALIGSNLMRWRIVSPLPGSPLRPRQSLARLKKRVEFPILYRRDICLQDCCCQYRRKSLANGMGPSMTILL